MGFRVWGLGFRLLSRAPTPQNCSTPSPKSCNAIPVPIGLELRKGFRVKIFFRPLGFIGISSGFRAFGGLRAWRFQGLECRVQGF